MANFHHNNRNHSYRGRGRKNQNVENRENREVRENDENKERRERRDNRERHDQQEARELYRERRERENREKENRDSRDRRERRDNRDNKENRDNQAISTFILGSKELEGKNAEFQYDKGWYSITDIVGEEKSVVYKSKNAQEAYTKWNVYIGRKKERPQRAEKTEG